MPVLRSHVRCAVKLPGGEPGATKHCSQSELNQFDRKSGEPNVELLESLLQRFFELDEELAVFGSVGNVHEGAGKRIAMRLSFMPPDATNDLRFARNGAEFSFQLQQRFGDEVGRNGAPVVKLRRKQDFVPAQSDHRWQDLQH